MSATVAVSSKRSRIGARSGTASAPGLARLARSDRFWLIVVLLAGFMLRAWRLGELPFGFHPDEGHYAVDAWSVWQGWRPVFMPGNNGREPLFMYLLAPLLGLVGPTIWTARLASAFTSMMVMSAAYACARLPCWPRRTGLLTAALMAVSFWPVAQGRYVLRAHLLPFWVALLLWALWRGSRPVAGGTSRARSLVWPGLAGLFLAAAVYTHLSGRLLPLVPVVAAGLAALQRRWRPAGQLLPTLTVAALLSVPLIAYFAQNPQLAGYRVAQVSALSPEVNEGRLVSYLARSGAALAETAFIRGDRSWYHNLPGRPVFGPLVGLAFLGGLALLARDASGRRGMMRQHAALVVAATLTIMAVPSWLSVGAPNYVRLTGTWPVLFLLPAWSLAACAARLDRWGRDLARGGACPGALRYLGSILIGALVVAVGVRTAVDYFGRYAPSPEVREAFAGDDLERARAIRRLMDGGRVCVAPAVAQQAVVRFVNLDAPPCAYDLLSGLVLPASGDATFAFATGAADEAARFEERWPGITRETVADSFGRPLLLVLRLPRSLWPRLPESFPWRFAQTIELGGVRLGSPSAGRDPALDLAFQWNALAPMPTDYNLFVRLEDPSGRIVAQSDGPPLAGGHGTDQWLPGESIIHTVRLSLPPDVGAGELAVLVGWYDYRTLERLQSEGYEDAGTLDEDAGLVVGFVRAATDRVMTGDAP